MTIDRYLSQRAIFNPERDALEGKKQSANFVRAFDFVSDLHVKLTNGDESHRDLMKDAEILEEMFDDLMAESE